MSRKIYVATGRSESGDGLFDYWFHEPTKKELRDCLVECFSGVTEWDEDELGEEPELNISSWGAGMDGVAHLDLYEIELPNVEPE